MSGGGGDTPAARERITLRSILTRGVTMPAWASITLVLTVAAIANAPTWRTIGDALRGSDATSLATLAPLAAVVTMLVAINRSGAPEKPKLEPAMLGAIPMLGAATTLALFGPARLGFDFWLMRIDLLAAMAFAIGALMLAVGVRACVGRYKIGFALVLLVPPVALSVVTLIERALSSLTRAVAVRLTDAFPLNVTHLHDGLFAIGTGAAAGAAKVSVADACSGVEGIVVVGLFAAPFLVGTEGSRARRWAVVGGGLLTAWLLNIVRVMTLLALAGHGHMDAFDTVHAVAGIVISTVVVLCMLLAAAPLGITWPRTGFRTGVTYTPNHVIWGGGLLVICAMLTLVGITNQAGSALNHTGINNRVPLAMTGSGAKSHVDLAAAGYTVRHDTDMQWFREFFGRDAHASTFTLTRPGAPTVWAQVIVSPSRRSLNQFGPIDCFIAHGATIYRARRVPLPGGSAMLVDQRQRATRFTALTWTQPVTLASGTNAFVRVVLFSKAKPGSDQKLPARGNTLTRTSFGLLNTFSPLPTHDPKGWAFGPSGRQTITAAEAIIAGTLRDR